MANEGVAWDLLMHGRLRQTEGSSSHMNEGAPDEELLARSTRGDRRAFDEIVTRHAPFALRVAARLVPDLTQAEDVVQEAMLRAWGRASHFEPRRARFTTWLYKVVINLCIDYRRRARPEPLPEHIEVIDPALGPPESIEMDERHAALAAALRGLPARQRAAMTLVYEEGLSGPAAAGVLGLSPKAVERLLARARTRMRRELQMVDSRGHEHVDL